VRRIWIAPNKPTNTPTASRVGHLRFTFRDTAQPYVFIEATRKSVVASNTSDLTYPTGAINPSNWTYPAGRIRIDPSTQEICGSNPERQDFILGPSPATSFAGYFCARFGAPFFALGTTQNGTVNPGEVEGEGSLLGAYVMFRPDTQVVDVRVGVSFISIDQARKNLETEVPDGTTLEATAKKTRSAWAEKLDMVEVEGGSEELRAVFYTAVFHALQVRLYTCRVIAYAHALAAVSIRAKRGRQLLLRLRRHHS
jgi:hypothetical protein